MCQAMLARFAKARTGGTSKTKPQVDKDGNPIQISGAFRGIQQRTQSQNNQFGNTSR